MFERMRGQPLEIPGSTLLSAGLIDAFRLQAKRHHQAVRRIDLQHVAIVAELGLIIRIHEFNARALFPL